MKIEIDDDVAQQIQSLTKLKLNGHDYDYFADWLLVVGVATVKTTLEQHPELTLGDLVMMQYRIDYNKLRLVATYDKGVNIETCRNT